MRRSAVAFVLATLALIHTPHAPAQTAGVEGGNKFASLAFYDSTGKWAGPVVGAFDMQTAWHTYALARVQDDLLAVELAQRGSYASYESISNGFVYFLTTDCSGPGYINVIVVPGATRPSVTSRNVTTGSVMAFMGSPSAVPAQIVHNSAAQSAGTSCLVGFSGRVDAIPVTAQFDLSSLWKPPFTAKLPGGDEPVRMVGSVPAVQTAPGR